MKKSKIKVLDSHIENTLIMFIESLDDCPEMAEFGCKGLYEGLANVIAGIECIHSLDRLNEEILSRIVDKNDNK